MNADLIRAKLQQKKAGDDLRQELVELCELVGSLEFRVFQIAAARPLLPAPHLGDVDVAIQELREAGLKAWDDVADPETLIREMRGDEESSSLQELDEIVAKGEVAKTMLQKLRENPSRPEPVGAAADSDGGSCDGDG